MNLLPGLLGVCVSSDDIRFICDSNLRPLSSGIYWLHPRRLGDRCRVFTEESWQADPSLSILSRLTGLTSLNLRSTHFSSGLEQLAALTCLQHLDLSLNPSFNGSGDAPTCLYHVLVLL